LDKGVRQNTGPLPLGFLGQRARQKKQIKKPIDKDRLDKYILKTVDYGRISLLSSLATSKKVMPMVHNDKPTISGNVKP